MARLRYNGLSATLGASLTASATAVTFGAALTHSGGVAVPTISGGDYVPLAILDATGKASEIVYLTAYASGATSGTITRAQESTTGVSHASGDKVVHGPTVTDFPSRAFVGSATPGASWENFASSVWYMKKITLPSDGLLTNIEGFIDANAVPGRVDAIAVALHLDNAGVPTSLLGTNQTRDQGVYLSDATTRWFGMPVGQWLTAGSYWISMSSMADSALGLRLAYGTGGGDSTFGAAGSWATGSPGLTSTSRNYALRANVVYL